MSLYKKQLYIYIFVLTFVGCDKILEDSSQVSDSSIDLKESTLNKANLGEYEANISDYFYDFNDNVYAQYLYYSEPYYEAQSNTIATPSILNPNRDTLNFRTFPDFLLDVTYDSLEVRGELYPLNEENSSAESWCEDLLLSACIPNSGDSLDFNEDGIFSDGVHTSYLIEDTTFSISYKNLDFMKWDSADGRYKTGLSASIELNSIQSFTPETDTYDSLIFIGVIDTLYNPNYKPIQNLVYVDRSEWQQYDTTFFTKGVTHELSAKFNYTIQTLGSDSLVFRNNGDCDRDGEWDKAELFYDYGRDFCPDSLETGEGKCTVVDEDSPGEVGYGSFLDEPPCHCLGNWVRQEIINELGVLELHWKLEAPVSNNSAWDAATSATNESDCLALNGTWDDPNIPYCLEKQEQADINDSIVCNFECLYDPNGDNWRDCGLDGYCPGNSLDLSGNESNTEFNGIWDSGEAMENNNKYDDETYKGEYYIDRANKTTDPAEYFYDANLSGVYDFGDTFEDRNCNGIWDDAETENVGNGIWDDAEKYIDLDGSGDWNNNEPLYVLNEAPNAFLVDYSEDYSSACQELEIFGKCPSPFKKFIHSSLDAGATNSITIFTHYNASGDPQFATYDNLIVSVQDSTTLKATYPDIEKIVTVYTNVLIDSLPGTVSDYYIAKAQWNKPILADDAFTVLKTYDYDYHIFGKSEDGNIVKMIHPQYFNHYGFYDRFDQNNLGDECSSCLETGLWNHASINEEVYIYAPDGKIRQGEYYYTDKEVVLELAEYRVEEEFKVEFCDGDGEKDDYCSVDNNQVPIEGNGIDEEVIIPAIKRVNTYSLIDANSIVCLATNDTLTSSTISPESLGQSCSTDTTLQEVFKVIRTRTITMLGNGLEFGSRNTLWLAKNLGVVKDKLELRWSSGFWEIDPTTGFSSEEWKEYSRLELNKLQYQNIDLMRRIMRPIQKVSYDNFEHIDLFNNDPYQNNHIIGLHRIRLSNE